MSAKAALRHYVETGRRSQHDAAGGFFAPDATINVVHPFNDMSRTEYEQDFLTLLQTAFHNLTRSDYIAFTGEFDGNTWATCTGYYSGHFAASFIGIPPTSTLSFLRFGEFHRMEDGQAVESYIFLDLPELMIASDVWPIAESPGVDRGHTGHLPGPVSCDGLQWHKNDPEHSDSSARMVTDMLRKLATKDEGWRPYWHNDMLWYGPAAFGAFAGIENFAGFQVPFEQAFEGWSGGASNNGMTAHFARFADGDYICTGGWPSLTGVQIGRYLGQNPKGERLYMRVCDWWRREDDLLVENWVFVDIPHVLLQMGLDVFGDLQTTSSNS